jgi:hypothetical protein
MRWVILIGPIASAGAGRVDMKAVHRELRGPALTVPVDSRAPGVTIEYTGRRHSPPHALGHFGGEGPRGHGDG